MGKEHNKDEVWRKEMGNGEMVNGAKEWLLNSCDFSLLHIGRQTKIVSPP